MIHDLALRWLVTALFVFSAAVLFGPYLPADTRRRTWSATFCTL